VPRPAGARGGLRLALGVTRWRRWSLVAAGLGPCAPVARARRERSTGDTTAHCLETAVVA